MKENGGDGVLHIHAVWWMGCLVAILIMAGSNILYGRFLINGERFHATAAGRLSRSSPPLPKPNHKYKVRMQIPKIPSHCDSFVSTLTIPFKTRTCWKLFSSFLDFFFLPLLQLFLRALFHQSFVIHTTKGMILPPLAAGGGIALVNVAALFLVA